MGTVSFEGGFLHAEDEDAETSSSSVGRKGGLGASGIV